MSAKKQSKIEDLITNEDDLRKAINKTGFVLEHLVASEFESQKWAVIHNRYYLDDVTPTQREMDMIAYKTTQLEDDVTLLTAVIISCKKNEEFDWAFLTRKAPGMAPNLNLLPLCFASNIDIFNTELSLTDWSKNKFFKKYDPSSLISKLFNYDRTVFAYQEIRKANMAVSNDSNIYNSIASLIKAQAFEVSALNNGRKKNKKYVYNINLLSVADLNFHEIHFEQKSTTVININRINYLNRFIINGQEQHSKIDFVRFENINDAIKDYNELHEWNGEFYNAMTANFYNTIFNFSDKKDLIINKSKGNILWKVSLYNDNFKERADDYSFFYLDLVDKELQINLSDSEETNRRLNNNPQVKQIMKKYLMDNFNFSGNFVFVDADLPF